MPDAKNLKQSYSATSYAFYSLNTNNKLISLSTTLPESNNADLTRFIESRLARGSVFSGNGQIVTVDLGIEPANCYFCLLSPNETGSNGPQFVLCFVTECDRGLESFRNQLDQYALKIECSLKGCELSESVSTVRECLSSWYRECLLFIINCVQVLGKDIKYVIYNAIASGQITIESDDKSFEADIERFHASCTLSALLSHAVASTESSDSSGSLIDLCPEPRTKTKHIIDILCITYSGNDISFSDHSCTEFCERWAQQLLEKFAYSAAEGGDINPVHLKNICETFKLKAIQEMNTLKRMVKEAELDFYALFRSNVFLKNSGNAQILLMHALNEEQTPDSLSILRLLKERLR
ncbi:protein Njmu-R1-like [Watersipora subatra]|uniref:protein Njmu-R1-like n=1 Tax=Watersipora subatra TaxID=2589382 RepID=UPI00355AF48D